jgi:hypothetical protein
MLKINARSTIHREVLVIAIHTNNAIEPICHSVPFNIIKNCAVQ